MQQVLGEILPLALGIAISPIPIIAIILMLITPKARSNGLAFLVGWMTGLAVVGGIALALANAVGLSASSEASQAESVIKLVLGVLLLLVALRQWRARPQPGETGDVAQVDAGARHVYAAEVVWDRRAALGTQPQEPRAEPGGDVGRGCSWAADVFTMR